MGTETTVQNDSASCGENDCNHAYLLRRSVSISREFANCGQIAVFVEPLP